MSRLEVDAVLELQWPFESRPRRAGEQHIYLYTALLGFDAVKVPVHVAFRVPDPESTTLHPAGTNARVVGPAQVVGRSFFVDATSVCPSDLDTADDDDDGIEQERPSTSLVFEGKVTSSDSAPSGGDLTIVNITVERVHNWADGPVTFRCRFDRTSVHLRTLEALQLGAAVVVSGILIGVTDGLLTVDIHDVCFDKDGAPCTVHAYIRGVPSCATACLCRWLDYMREGDSDSTESSGVRVGYEEDDDWSLQPIHPVAQARDSASAASDDTHTTAPSFTGDGTIDPALLLPIAK